MDMFEKATKAARNVGDSVINSAKNIGTTLYSSTKEQSELASLNIQKSVVDKRLAESYQEIGKRYVAYIDTCEGDTAFAVEDILEKMRPDLEKAAEIKSQIAQKEQQIRQDKEERLKKKAEEDFDAEIKKLDRALDLEIITPEEYEAKRSAAQKKLDHYDDLRKIQMQLEMGIINRTEYEEKVKSILQ